MIVGGAGSRGVVLSATYEARAFGVHAAMPMARARRLCPLATIIEPDHARYAEVSRGVMAVFRDVTPAVEPLSLDEAFLDVAGAVRRLGSPLQIAERVRERVQDEQGVACSVGVAATKFLAGGVRPGQARRRPRRAARRRPGGAAPAAGGRAVGRGGEDRGDAAPLRAAHRRRHRAHPARHPGARARRGDRRAPVRVSWGRDPRPVVPQQSERSIGAEETFTHDVDDPEVVHRELLRLAERTAARMRSAGQVGRTVSIKVRFADFTTITRARTLREATDVGRDVYATARDLFDALGLHRARLRLVGVRVEGLLPVEQHQRRCCSTRSRSVGATPSRPSTEPAHVSAQGRCAPPASCPASATPCADVPRDRRPTRRRAPTAAPPPQGRPIGRFHGAAVPDAAVETPRTAGCPTAATRPATRAPRCARPSRDRGGDAGVDRADRCAGAAARRRRQHVTDQSQQIASPAFTPGVRDLSLRSKGCSTATPVAVGSRPFPRTQREVAVPLSEHEQHLLEQMESAMYAEDPKFASAMRGRTTRSRHRRRLLLGGVALLVGLVLVVVGVTGPVALAVVGFVIMLVGAGFALAPERRGPIGAVGPTGQPLPRRRAPRSERAGRSSGFMDRLEQRWDRRRDGGQWG
nr:DUF3040 domain-containing protein [Angustibacter aerolatus]